MELCALPPTEETTGQIHVPGDTAASSGGSEHGEAESSAQGASPEGEHANAPLNADRLTSELCVGDPGDLPLLSQTSLPIALLDANLVFQWANPAFYALTRTQGQLLQGWTLQHFAQSFWTSPVAVAQIARVQSSALGSRQAVEVQTRSVPAQTLLVQAEQLQKGDAFVVLLALQDVTLARENERRSARQLSTLANQLHTKDTLITCTQAELRSLAQHLFTVREQERERIASDLHDDIGQRLSLLHMSCAALSQQPNAAALSPEIADIQRQVQSLADDVRIMSHNLHPALLKQLGLVVALRALVDDFGAKENQPVTLISSIGTLRPSDLASTTCFRVTQEALRNIAKHAGKTHVEISLDQMKSNLRLQIRDFGHGFDQTSQLPYHGLGLTSMRERTRIAGGTFSITSTRGLGTAIVVDVPSGVDA